MSERRRVRHARLRQELPGRLEIRRSDSLRRILHSDRGSRQMLVSLLGHTVFGRQQLLVSCPRVHDVMDGASALGFMVLAHTGLIPRDFLMLFLSSRAIGTFFHENRPF